MDDDGECIPADVRAVADRLSDRDWQSLTLQLGRYALHRSRRFFWRTGGSGELPDGERTESIVSKAFVLWLTGRRRWNRREYVDLQAFLKGVIDSLLSHAASADDNRRVASDADPISATEATPESDLLARERADEAARLLDALVTRSQQDAVAIEILEAIRHGAATRRAIVLATGRPIGVIDNGLKRLRRTGASLAGSRHDQRPSR